MLCLFVSTAAADDDRYSTGYTLTIELAKEAFQPGEAIEGEVAITATRSGYPVTFLVRIYRDDELRYNKIVQFPQLFMGHEAYPLETFGITKFSEPGRWRIEIGPEGTPEATVTLEVAGEESDAPSAASDQPSASDGY